MKSATIKPHKTASIGKKILIPILVMIFFQVILFWVFIFQLGLFEDVISQAKKNFFNNASINADFLDSEMWFHFSDLSTFSKPIHDLGSEYAGSRGQGSDFSANPNLLTDIVLKSPHLHADGIYLELFDSSSSKVFHFHSDSKRLGPLVRRDSLDFTQDILPLFSEYDTPPADNPALREFLNHLAEGNQSPTSLTMYERGRWSPILSLDGSNPALLFAIPLNYQNTHYGFLATEVFLSSFDALLSDTSFPDNFSHQAILIRYHHLTSSYEIIADKAFQMNAVNADTVTDTLLKSQLLMNRSSTDLLSSLMIDGQKYFCSTHLLTHSSPQSIPFLESSFYYVVLSPQRVVLKEADLLIKTFLFLIILFLLFGVMIALFITNQVVLPISALNSAIGKKEFPENFLSLPQTKISEIDRLTNTIISQNQNISNFHQTITDILMASDINLVTFYSDTAHNVTHGFGTFQALLGDDFDNVVMTFTNESFARLKERIYQNFTLYSSDSNQFDQSTIQTDIYLDQRTQKYICVKTRELEHEQTIVMLDYTNYVLEQEKIKKERDYDVLTSLLNRFSFTQKVTEYLSLHPDAPVCMAMWDLDFLKTLNDTYGHDIGDRYLNQAGNILQGLNPEKSFVARVSGDEFFAFLFDYANKEALTDAVRETHQRLNASTITLPNGERYNLSASCGYVCSVGGDYEDLKKYADLAMYVSKKSVKGSIHEFDPQNERAADSSPSDSAKR